MHYTTDFYDDQVSGSRRSAETVLPLIFETTGVPNRIVDVGGGVGTWASTALELGVNEVLVLDGAWVPTDLLEVPTSSFAPADLAQANSVQGVWDMAFCLEVAEHLPVSRGPSLVSELCRAAPWIVFSAALPGQGGTGHINEQWLSYWKALFKQHRYQMIDAIRPRVWDNSHVEWWYAQNIVLFCRDEHNLDAIASLPVDIVHPRAWVLLGPIRPIPTHHLEETELGGDRPLPPTVKRAFWRAARASLPIYRRLPVKAQYTLRRVARRFV